MLPGWLRPRDPPSKLALHRRPTGGLGTGDDVTKDNATAVLEVGGVHWATSTPVEETMLLRRPVVDTV